MGSYERAESTSQIWHIIIIIKCTSSYGNTLLNNTPNSDLATSFEAPPNTVSARGARKTNSDFQNCCCQKTLFCVLFGTYVIVIFKNICLQIMTPSHNFTFKTYVFNKSLSSYTQSRNWFKPTVENTCFHFDACPTSPEKQTKHMKKKN